MRLEAAVGDCESQVEESDGVDSGLVVFHFLSFNRDVDGFYQTKQLLG